MNKIKLYLIIAGIVIIASAFVTANILIKENRKLKAEVQRVQLNNLQLMSEGLQQTNLYLKEKEVTGRLKIERDSLAKSLKIKPKFIDRIVTQTISIHDTIIKEVPIQLIGTNHWIIADTGKCYIWKGEVFLEDNLLRVHKTGFDYSNKTKDIYWRKRPFNLWFIHLGKPIHYHQISSECGKVSVKTFDFIK